MIARRSVLVVSVCGLAGIFALGAASAGAAITHQLLSRIGEVPAGPGVTSSGPIVEPQALTADAGALYVADGGYEHGRLDKFDPSSGSVELQFAQVPSLSYLRQGVAVAHGSGEVYVGADFAGTQEGAVAAFSAAGSLEKIWDGRDTPEAAGISGFGCFECGGPGEVAVDNNPSSLSDWAAGDVLVAEPARGVVDVFKPKAGGEEEWVARISEREAGVPLEGVFGVAVDSATGDVFVIDADGVDVFEPTVLDQYVLVRRLSETRAGSPFGHIDGVAVDGGNGDVYVRDDAEPRVIDQFSSAGVYLGSLKGTPSGAFGGRSMSLAVDPGTHDLYVGDRQGEAEVVDAFGPNVAIPDVATEPVSALKPRSTTLNGTVNPEAIQLSDCSFDYGTSTAYGQSAPCVPAAGAIPADSSQHAVSAQVAALAPDSTYHFRLRASNANGTNTESGDQEFSTPGPGIHSTSVVAVTSNSATLEASIDPDNTATTYYFQYGTSTAYGSEAPAAPGLSVGAGKGDVEVSRPVTLMPLTVYHYHVVVRAVVSGEPFEETSPDRTFTTKGGQASGLPDGRAWEMVSPPDKHGAALDTQSSRWGGGLVAAAQDGGAVVYLATGPVEGEPAGNRSLVFTEVLTRRGSGGWVSRGITTPNESPAFEGEEGTEYKLFSGDLSAGLVEVGGGDTPLSPAASERTPYRREANGEYTPLVTAANVPAGTKFGSEAGVAFEGASPDLSHVVLSSSHALTPGVASSEVVKPSLYEWAGGSLRLVSILPDGTPASEEGEAAYLGSGLDVRRAVSEDGSRIAWTAGGHLYVRDMRLGGAVQVDAPEAGAQGGQSAHGAVFQTASSDGSKVFFTDEARLTKDATSSYGEPDLYMCEVGEAAGEPTCTLKDLTVDGNALEAANVQGVVLEASEDGRCVYFVAGGVLAPGAVPGGDNLYVYDTVAGEARLVAVLSSEDSSDWSGGGVGSASITNTVRVSPNGRYLAFMSLRSLTGYDNIDAHSGQPDAEVFLYDVSSNGLVCASCNPTGARPAGVFDTDESPGLLVDRTSASRWHGAWLAGSIPGWELEGDTHTWYQSRYLSDSGRLFFNAADGLVPGDTNGLEDVYEYEPGGVGGCAGPGGCVGLLSSGTSREESAFLDASDSGSDVFFLTASRLVPQDTDSELDVYDARVCTGASPCLAPRVVSVPPLPCASGDACRGAGGALQGAFGGVPSSTAATAAGNLAAPAPARPVVKGRRVSRGQKLASALRACKKKKVRHRRVVCEARARRSYGKGAPAKRSGGAGATRKGNG